MILKKNNIILSGCIGLVVIILVLIISNKHYSDSSEVIRIGIITDIHAYRVKKSGYNITEKVKKPLQYFIDRMNRNFKPAFVVQAGDFIEGTSRKGQQSIDDFNKTKEYYDTLEMPHYHVIGNHDARGLSKEEWLQLTKYDKAYYYFDYQNLRTIILDLNDGQEKRPAGVTKHRYYHITDEQISWLEGTLNDANNKGLDKIVFIHQFVDDPSSVIPILNSRDKKIFPENSKKLRNLFSEYHVKAVFSGHLEKVFYEKVNDVQYFSLPGLYKSDKKKVQWLESFSEVTINDDVEVKLFYKRNTDENYSDLIIPSEEYDQIEK